MLRMVKPVHRAIVPGPNRGVVPVEHRRVNGPILVGKRPRLDARGRRDVKILGTQVLFGIPATLAGQYRPGQLAVRPEIVVKCVVLQHHDDDVLDVGGERREGGWSMRRNEANLGVRTERRRSEDEGSDGQNREALRILRSAPESGPRTSDGLRTLNCSGGIAAIALPSHLGNPEPF